MKEQLEWLGALLSTRGMPRIMLAAHMEILSDELTLISNSSDDYAREDAQLMDECASELRQVTESRFLASVREKQSIELRKRLGKPSDDFRCREAVDLIAGALADEADSIEGSLDTLLSYLADKSRFLPSWTEGIHEQTERLRGML